ncbi:MAG TPA: MBL fold metallo-hydrolase [Planctomycetota bacterium]|nr:MBL fold metallo-hydrolase [Planctomycetota bacterium]
MARLYVLGGGGWVPTPRRSTNCYLLETRRSAILFDCGAGAARLGDPMIQAVLRRVPRVLVLLSHYHHDHVEGLSYLPFFLRDHELVVAAPPSKTTGIAARDALERFAGSPFLPRPLLGWASWFPKGFEAVELREGRNRVAGESVEVAPQPHSDPCVGFRVRDVCYVTDTTARPETAAFAKGAALLVHDAWLDAEDREAGVEDLSRHATAEGAATIARDAGVRELVLAHLNPAYPEARLERMRFAAARIFPSAHLADDFRVFEAKAADDEEAAVEAADPAAAVRDDG